MPPNIVLILADDLGACDLGFFGNADASTPVLDALAGRSLRHEAFYVTPVCAPTRAALLTGRHHLRTGVAGVHGGKDHIHRSETLLPEVLKEAGYVSGIWGKWHSGTADGYLPHQRGF
ncbi:MAG: sulfatase-like hydrolase/transferase, partial [Verrucomicrobia bacterium]|nr:sulfatase-like hydrolase/transferase [Verrucomicrobiota bacterium]